MNLNARLSGLARPVKCAVIGCGKFTTMFLSQVHRLPNIEIGWLVDLSPDRVDRARREAGYDREAGFFTARSTDDVAMCMDDPSVDIIIEATGDPIAGTRHALAAINAGKHVIMVTVEADVLVGPLLAERARDADVVYSLAYGDQPALVSELVDWARMCGFEVVAAGKGTKYLPEYRYSTPATVWGHYGFETDYALTAGLNSQMFNSFLDGTKSAIEMAAVANACGLAPPDGGLTFPPCGVDELASVCIPAEHGGSLAAHPTVEVVSSLYRDGRPVLRDLRWGVYVTFAGASQYVADCFSQYGVRTDGSGHFAAMYRPSHLIGLELGVSVGSIAARSEPTGTPAAFLADVASIAKRDLRPGDRLDGEGGYTVYGSVVPAPTSVESGLLPIGFSKGAEVIKPVSRDTPIRWRDVVTVASPEVLACRRELEEQHAMPAGGYA